MVVEILNNSEKFNVSVHELKDRLAVLREEWSRIEVFLNETLHSPFDVLIEQVKREIRNCGFVLDEEPNADSVAIIGDSQNGIWVFHCSPKVLVVVHFTNEEVGYDDGYQDIKGTLSGIQVMELE